MNNAKIAIENVSLEIEKPVDVMPMLRKRAEELTDIIEAINAIRGSSYWKTLEQKVFSGVTSALYKKLENESDEKEIFRLQGQIRWAEKYSDLSKLSDVYNEELKRIKKQI